MSAREKIAYLRGLLDGRERMLEPEEQKFNSALLDALTALSEEIALQEELYQELREYVEVLDEGLTDLEEQCDDDCCCGEDEEGSFDEEEYASVLCPHCHSDFFYEPSAYDEDEDLLCPICGKVFKQTFPLPIEE